MKRINNVFFYESLYLLKQKVLLLPLLLYLLFLTGFAAGYELHLLPSAPKGYTFYNLVGSALKILLFIIGIFATIFASKNEESEFESLVMTYPIYPYQWVLGKWLVVQAYGVLFSILTTVLQAIYVHRPLEELGILFLNMQGSIFFIASLGIFVGVSVRGFVRFLVVPALLAMVLMFEDASTADYLNPKLQLLLFYEPIQYADIWGIINSQDIIIHQIVMVSLGIGLLTVTLYIRSFKQKMNKSVGYTLIASLLLFAGTSYISYKNFNEKYSSYIEEATHYKVPMGNDGNDLYYNYKFDNVVEENYHVNTMKLNLLLKKHNQIEVSSEFQVENNSNEPIDEIVLTLQHDLQITSLTGKNIQSWNRKDDFIYLILNEAILPEESTKVNLTYKGSVDKYRRNGEIQQSFITEDRVYLPKDVGWYPLAGKKQLLISQETNNNFHNLLVRSARIPETKYPTSYKVYLTTDAAGITYKMTIPSKNALTFEGETTTGLTLIGGDIQEKTIEDIRVITSSSDTSTQQVIRPYIEVWTYLDEWLGDFKPETVLVDYMKYSYYRNDNEIQQPNRTFFIREAFPEFQVELIPNWNNFIDMKLFEENMNLQLLDVTIKWHLLTVFSSAPAANFEDYAREKLSSNENIESFAKEVRLLSTYDEQTFKEAVQSIYKDYRNDTTFSFAESLEDFDKKAGE